MDSRGLSSALLRSRDILYASAVFSET